MKKNGIMEVLASHRKWLNHDGGKRADLRGANLREADLSGANLIEADLSEANLSEADLSEATLREANLIEADLSKADLREANLREADLSKADLSEANLREADLRGANLRGANLSGANLSGADLSWANLSRANLSGANLRGAKTNETTGFVSLQCPEKGSYTGFKKAGTLIVELEIPADALRSSATTRKCRASKARVVSITDVNGNPGPESVQSNYDKNFVYKVGETVEVTDFDPDRWNECAPGIHHFITRVEAVNYDQ